METAAYLIYHEMHDTSTRCTCAPYTIVGRQVSSTQGDVAGVPQEYVTVFVPPQKDVTIQARYPGKAALCA